MLFILCVHVICMEVPWRPEGFRFPGQGDTGSCEHSGTESLSSESSNPRALTTEQALQPEESVLNFFSLQRIINKEPKICVKRSRKGAPCM